MDRTHHDYAPPRAAERLAVGLGFFSIGLGIAEVAAPSGLARLAGLPDDERTATLLRVMGAREIGNGIAILMQPGSALRLWARVGGDALDLAALGASLRAPDADRARLLSAIGAVAGVTALDVLAAQKLSANGGRAAARRGLEVRVEKVATINRPIHEVYQFWRNFENLPRFMRHLESVEVLDGRRSRWRAKAPAGMTVEWEAEILQDREQEWIAWRSLEGSQVPNSGSVRFTPAPGGRGTEVRVQLQYSPPAGRVGRLVAKLFGEEPELQVREDLRRFKQLMETGEIPVSDAPGLWRPAQPPANPEKLKAFAGVRS